MTKANKAVSPAPAAALELLPKETVASIITARYAVPGGTKAAVMRDLFARGYKVAQVHKMLDGTEYFKALRYQMVRNYHEQWVKAQAK
jgi:hypothetical protein